MSKTTTKKLLQSMTKAQFDVSVGTSAVSVSVFENVKRYHVRTHGFHDQGDRIWSKT